MEKEKKEKEEKRSKIRVTVRRQWLLDRNFFPKENGEGQKGGVREREDGFSILKIEEQGGDAA